MSLPNPRSLYFGLKPNNCLRKDSFGCKSIPSCNCTWKERKFQLVRICIRTMILKGVGSSTPVTSLRQVPILVNLFIRDNPNKKVCQYGAQFMRLFRSLYWLLKSLSYCARLAACLKARHHGLLDNMTRLIRMSPQYPVIAIRTGIMDYIESAKCNFCCQRRAWINSNDFHP